MRRAGAEAACGADEIAVAGDERGAAHQPRRRRPADQHGERYDPNDADLVGLSDALGQAELMQVERGQHDQQRQQRQRDDGVGAAHQYPIGPAAGLGWLPASGIATAGINDAADRLRHLVLPVATLTLVSAASYTRYVRAAMREALAQDHIRTARAKGASEARVVLHHALRSALVPVTTILALSFGGLVSGALVTETMFGYPGMGKLIFDAVMGNDYNLALAALLLAAAVTMAANLAADLAYAWLDPRVSYR